jgi:DNA-binding NarL/FixJ family response regulator
MINVYIVDDHHLMVEGLCKMINESGFASVGACFYDLKSCRTGLEKAIPDVLLLDIDLPDGYGDEFCREILEIYPSIKIMILTGFEELNIARRSLKSGALGYALKNSMSEEILLGIETVAQGEKFLCEKIDIMMKKRKNEEEIFITKRERDILKYTAKGLTSAEISDKLFLSEETIKGYRKDIMLKLGAKNGVEMIQKANEQKLIPKD